MIEKKLCVIGDPVEHSKSPLLQNAMLKALHLPYQYGKVLVHRGETAQWLKKAKEEGYAGFNATMPHKIELMPLVDVLGQDAWEFGAINTVCIRENGTVEGHNTDGRGFLRAVQDINFDPVGKNITILGAGGAAKAVALKLVMEGADQVSICNRTVAKAEQLCKYDPGRMRAFGFSMEELSRMAGESDLIVNCTSLGMTGTDSQFEDLSFLQCMKSGCSVFDVIYAPAETQFLKKARELGAVASNGLGMLLYQAVYALEHFAQTSIDESKMRILLEDVFNDQ